MQTYAVRRSSICVAGVSRDAVLTVKSLVAGVTSQPLPLESFHVKRRSDVSDGAMLVPKVVLAAAHRPGLKFIDRTPAAAATGHGQLDFLYDEVRKIGGKSTRSTACGVTTAPKDPAMQRASRGPCAIYFNEFYDTDWQGTSDGQLKLNTLGKYWGFGPQ